MEIAWLVILVPLTAAVICLGMSLLRINRGAHWVSIAGIGAAAGVSLHILKYFAYHPDAKFTSTAYPWIDLIGNWALFSIRVDSLTALMLAVVTVVGWLIIVYSRGYMAGDEGFARFFAEMSLFVAAMCTLVLADNFLMLYLGWEGVGLCSFLLIGFWFHRPAASAAAVKAFVVTRIGDTGLIIGIFLIFLTFGTLDFATVFSEVPNITPGLATAIALLLLAGAVGKSAQVPLYVWLPDAMEGPSPTSALIHAATMVTAGVYLVARTAPIFLASHVAYDFVAVVGAVTAIYAATIALGQFDIKRILAYSTISQIGYMFLAVGVLAPTAGIFHLATHAFFKALLFLAAGAVMHATAGIIDIRQIGGLKRHMPITYWTFLIGALALAGLPPFSGFWSKDEIIAAAWDRWPTLAILGWITILLTTWYTFRLFFRTFHGPEKIPPEVHGHLHPVDVWMKIPLILLAVGAAGLGLILSLPFDHSMIHRLLAPPLAKTAAAAHANIINLPFYVTTAAQLIIIALAWIGCRREITTEPLLPAGLFRLFNHKYYVDEAYDAAVVKPAYSLAEGCNQTDDDLVDGILAGVAALPHRIGRALRPAQQGFLQGYALGVAVLLAIMLVAIVRLLGTKP